MTMDRGINQVRVRGAGVPMNVPREAPEPPTNPYYPYPGERPDQPSEQASSWDPVRELANRIASGTREAVSGFGETGLGRFLRNASPRGPEGARERFNEDITGLIDRYTDSPYIPVVSQLLGLGKLATGTLFNDGTTDGTAALPAKQRGIAEKPTQETAYTGPSFEERLAEYQFDGTPYDRAAEYMQERRAAQMRAVQDMYNQYAAEAAENAARVADIYEGAQAGIGETYAGATGNIEDAYASAQQQAADQMARLGIEEAAPAVIDPMALSQAETLSNLETGQASSLGATQQFGATAGGFSSNMAQIAQQQALENQRSATDQLVDQLFELEMQRAQAEQAYNPYQQMLQEMEARGAYEQMVNPQPDLGALQDEAEFLYRQEQDDIDNFYRAIQTYQDQLGGDLEERQKTAYEAAMRDAQTGMFGPRLKAEADAYFAGQGAEQ